MADKTTLDETDRTIDGTEAVRLATTGANWKATLSAIKTFFVGGGFSFPASMSAPPLTAAGPFNAGVLALITPADTSSPQFAIGQFAYGNGGSTRNNEQISVGYNYKNGQLMLSNVSFTGTGSGTNFTASSVTGRTIRIGDILSGTGVPSGTTIVSQTSGTPGGAGVYVTSGATTSSGATITGVQAGFGLNFESFYYPTTFQQFEYYFEIVGGVLGSQRPYAFASRPNTGGLTSQFNSSSFTFADPSGSPTYVTITSSGISVDNGGLYALSSIRSSSSIGAGVAAGATLSGIFHAKDSNNANIFLENTGGSGRKYALASYNNGKLFIMDLTANKDRWLWDASGHHIGAPTLLHGWSATEIGVLDTAFGRNAAGVVEVNNGTLGTLAGFTASYVKPKSYTVGTVPSASTTGAGSMIYVSDEAGGAVTAFSDATNWRRVTDRAIIS